MNDYYTSQWFNDRWESMSVDLRTRAVETLDNAISEEDQELIRRKHAEYGEHEWIHRLIDIDPEETPFLYESGMTVLSGHHGFGTAIRNLLRDEEYGAGIKDEDLPPAPYENGHLVQNWDDYYVQAIEAAVGLRYVV